MNKINPYLILLIRCLLGLVFVYASYDKILDPGKFARDIANYHIVPFGLENSIAIILPWLELLIGAGIILGIFLDGSVVLSGSFLILFIFMIFQAMMRGFNIECGCGLKEGEMVGWSKILENIVFLGASYIVFYSRNRVLEIYPKTPLSE
tara:strand:+ start:400 stop:849 length:450 start_codon:yes stop_codon:yes gene_type:complete